MGVCVKNVTHVSSPMLRAIVLAQIMIPNILRFVPQVNLRFKPNKCFSRINPTINLRINTQQIIATSTFYSITMIFNQ